MKKLDLFILLVCLSACKQIPFMGSPLVEYEKDKNLLTVHNFKWSYGTVGINRFSGDFETLDKAVYEELKSNSGSCLVYFRNVNKNKYGEDSISVDTVGYINIDELNKFQGWEYWHKQHGMQSLLYKKYVHCESNNVISNQTRKPTYDKVETTPIMPNTSTDVEEPVDANTHLFSIEQLYPTGNLPPTNDTDRFVITGTIDKIKFDDGVFGVITVDGDKVVMMFDPDHMEASEVQRFSSVLVYGNEIKCVGTNAGESLYALLAAKITIR